MVSKEVLAIPTSAKGGYDISKIGDKVNRIRQTKATKTNTRPKTGFF
jgi:hypothetical protein